VEVAQTRGSLIAFVSPGKPSADGQGGVVLIAEHTHERKAGFGPTEGVTDALLLIDSWLRFPAEATAGRFE
jgi:hypothetical protein